jgi:hypothetical protein
MQLTWQPGFSLSRKPAKRPVQHRNRQERFEFVVEHPQRAHRARRSPSATSFTHSKSRSNSFREHSIIVNTHRAYLQSEAVEESEPPIDLSLRTLDDESSIRSAGSPDLETIDGATEPRPNSCNCEYQSTSTRSPDATSGERNITGSGPDSAVVSALTYIPSPLFKSVPPTIEYSSLTQRFRPILNRCMPLVRTYALPNSDEQLLDNSEFCTIPLTFQLRINPFQYRPDLDPEPTFLVHAVMALSGHHVNSISTLNHRHTSLQLLRQNLNAFSDAETMYSVLDTIVILFSLDVSQTSACLRLGPD